MRTVKWKQIVCLATLSLLAGCGRGDADGEGEEAAVGITPNEVVLSAAQVQHGRIAWAAVAMTDAAQAAVVPGLVVPNEDLTARLDAPLRGRVIAVRVRPGDAVRAGQDLVVMHSPEAGMARSDVDKAEAELASRKAEAAYAKSARDRSERLLALKAIPRQDYERTIADEELARAALAQAEAELRRAQSTAEQLAATTTSGEVVLRAPLAGVVLARNAVPGTVVEAGAPLIAVTNPTRLWLTIDAPEQFAPLLRAGNPLSFTVTAYPQAQFAARIEAVGAGLDPQTRTLPVRAVVNNQDGRLRPQMIANVRIEGGQRVPAAQLPADAVQMLKGKPVVFVAAPDGKGGARMRARDVTVGERSGGQIAVLSGLQAGELVVTRGAFSVKAQIEKASMPEMEM